MSALFDIPEKVPVDEQIPRDRWKRPLVVPPVGGKPVAYTRCTRFVDALEDKYNLTQWEKRMVATGLAERADLLLAVAAHRDDKQELNRIADAAKEAARASAAATTGTALHALTELVDQGQTLPALPESAYRDIRAYEKVVQNLEPVVIEQFGVCDELKVGGTWDRIYKVNGKYYIGDVKTGNITEGAMKIAMQLAVYAHSVPYDWVEQARYPHPFRVNQDWALVVHLPAGQGRCELKWIDIHRGWQAVQVAALVHQWRKYKDWYRDFTDTLPTPEGSLDSWLDEVEECTSFHQLVSLLMRAEQQGAVCQELEAACVARKQELEKDDQAHQHS